jgi:hypothetical protein
MFVDKLGYTEVGRSGVFKEVTLERKVDDVLVEMGKQLKVSSMAREVKKSGGSSLLSNDDSIDNSNPAVQLR